MSVERKYLSEHAVGFCSSNWMMIPAQELAGGRTMPDEVAKISENCHIYLICKRPAVSYDPTSITINSDSIEGRLVYKINGLPIFNDFKSHFVLLDNAVRAELDGYPHREIKTFAADGSIVRKLSAFGHAMLPSTTDRRLRNLEVLYVGQAFAEGRRSAVDRLRSHSTLQRILAETQHSHPDDEILILAFEYNPNDMQLFTSMDGANKTAIRDETDTERYFSILDNPLTQNEQICLIEAGLIRYFQPLYNEIYKSSFPAKDQKILYQCMQRDISALVVEINTDDYDISLFSSIILPSDHHISQFSLFDPKERLSFFTFTSIDGDDFTMPGVIGPSR